MGEELEEHAGCREHPCQVPCEPRAGSRAGFGVMPAGGSPSPPCTGGPWSAQRLLGRTRAGQGTRLAPPALYLLLSAKPQRRELGVSFWSKHVFLNGNWLSEKEILISLEMLLLFEKSHCGFVP